MGANVSTVSQVIGFVSFTFTLLTLLRVTWGSFMTIFAAPREARDYLDNLRQEIYELREDLKKANRRHRPRSNSEPKSGTKSSFESGSLRVLYDTMKHLQREFVKLERPFLEEARDDGDIDSPWIHYTARVNYCDMNLSQRFAWLRTRAEVIDMAQRVDRIQTRKIAHEMQSALIAIQSLERSMQHTDGRNFRERSEDERIYVHRRN